MSFGKPARASVENSIGAEGNVNTETKKVQDVIFNVNRDNNSSNSVSASFIWILAKLNDQKLPIMVDSGATPNCLALRCVEASSCLKNILRHPYNGGK